MRRQARTYRYRLSEAAKKLRSWPEFSHIHSIATFVIQDVCSYDYFYYDSDVKLPELFIKHHGQINYDCDGRIHSISAPPRKYYELDDIRIMKKYGRQCKLCKELFYTFTTKVLCENCCNYTPIGLSKLLNLVANDKNELKRLAHRSKLFQCVTLPKQKKEKNRRQKTYRIQRKKTYNPTKENIRKLKQEWGL